jgi:choline kinase
MFPMLIFCLFNNQSEPHKENDLIFINSHFSEEFYIEQSDFLFRNFLIESTNSASEEHLIAMSHMNIGICYDELKRLHNI